MSQYPTISVIMPTFNSERFIREALDSIRNQNYPNLELVIVDGGSTDHTLEIIKEYDDFNKIMLVGKDQGLNHAVNKGIMAATSEYCIWSASDDLLSEGALLAVGDKLREDPDIDLLYGDARQVDEHGTFIRNHGAVPYDKSKLFHERCYIPCQSVVFRRKAISLTGLLDTSLVWNGDWDLWKRFAKNDHVLKIVFLDKVIGDWRIHEGAITHRGGSRELFLRSLETIRSTRKYSSKGLSRLELKLYPYLLVGLFGLRGPAKRLGRFLRGK